VVDEKHSWHLGSRVYLATTAAQGCILGLELSEGADAQSLTQAYGVFASEALAHHPNYRPESVNLDGWEPTAQAWQTLFPGISIILCFLHSLLKVGQYCRRDKDLWTQLRQKLWHAYRSINPRQMAQRLRRIREWCSKHNCSESVQSKVQSMASKASAFSATFAHPDGHRTSNQVDRLINFQDRLLYAMQYFHGTHRSTRQALRAMALIWNFHPYTRKAQVKAPYCASPFEDLNRFRYHDNWLRNLLLASSLNARGNASPTANKTKNKLS
jgi:hypothetical protein